MDVQICPHCNAHIESVTIKQLQGTVGDTAHWKCVAYSCPSCKKILSVQADPAALKKDIAKVILTRIPLIR